MFNIFKTKDHKIENVRKSFNLLRATLDSHFVRALGYTPDYFFAGGSVRDSFNGRSIRQFKDVDVYFVKAREMQEYMRYSKKYNGIDNIDDKATPPSSSSSPSSLTILQHSDKAAQVDDIQTSNLDSIVDNSAVRYQMVFSKWGNPGKVIEQFDLNHARNYVWGDGVMK